MNISCNEKGLQIKKLFRSREILYSDIKSVIIIDGEFSVTTKEGEVFTGKFGLFSNPTPFYEAVQKYNIYFLKEPLDYLFENYKK